MSRIVHLDGRLVEEEAARISPFDRGFLLGDGVFDTLRAYGGRPFLLDEHLARLANSCRAARLPFPEDLPRRIEETLRANGLDDAAVRVTITRGPGGRGASIRGAGPPTVLVTVTNLPAAPAHEDGIRVVTASRLRVPPASLDPAIKSTNYLVHVLARAEAEDAGADDAIFVDTSGLVIEATQANVFAVFGTRLVTPPLDSGCLPGETRALLLRLAARAGLSAAEAPLPRESLHHADEVFLTGSVSEVVPVVALDGASIGTGRPGEKTRALHALYRKLAMARAEPGRKR